MPTPKRASVLQRAPRRRIKKAIASPKPTGAIAKLDELLCHHTTGFLDGKAAVFMGHVASQADLIDSGPVRDADGKPIADAFLLAPVTTAMLDYLAEFGAEQAEFGGDYGGLDDREPDVDDEDNGDSENDNSDDEPNVGAPDTVLNPNPDAARWTLREWRENGDAALAEEHVARLSNVEAPPHPVLGRYRRL
jgi:hypothetical protein